MSCHSPPRPQYLLLLECRLVVQLEVGTLCNTCICSSSWTKLRLIYITPGLHNLQLFAFFYEQAFPHNDNFNVQVYKKYMMWKTLSQRKTIKKWPPRFSWKTLQIVCSHFLILLEDLAVQMFSVTPGPSVYLRYHLAYFGCRILFWKTSGTQGLCCV